MQLGMIGLGRMGANIVRRLMRAGHECVVHDVNAANVRSLAHEGAAGAASLESFAASLAAPRVVWIMVPAAAVEETIASLAPLLERGDIVIDGGNSHYVEDIRRARELAARGIIYLDVGTSGGVWGLEQGYCLMVGGDEAGVRHVAPIFEALAPGENAAAATPSRGREGTAQRGWLHCGAAGAGHFVKMVHNGIEYGMMAAFAEGFNLLRHANAGAAARGTNAETAPLAHPGHFLYDLDLAEVAEVWRRGSVVRSWLLDLIAEALAKDPRLEGFEGIVSDSGEGRWTVNAAVEASVPVPVLSAALYARFSSRGEEDFANRLLSAMRREFGGHVEQKR
jgi:6-phosphogluconate dehydrogenase